MRNPQGYAVLQGPPGLVRNRDPGLVSLERQGEADTFTCHHCQHIVTVPVRARPEDLGGHCKICDRLICPVCVDKGTCTPWEKQMEISEARQALFRAL